MTKPLEEGFIYEGTSLDEDLPMPGKVTFDNLSKIEDRSVRYNDIDLNGHLNNTKYIDYIIDTHDINFYKKYRVNEILINYEKEIKNGDRVAIFTDGNMPEIIVGDVENTHSFVAKITYAERNN